MTSGQPQGDIIIDPNYHRTPYFRQSTQSQQREKVLTFYVYRYSDQRQGPLNNNACDLDSGGGGQVEGGGCYTTWQSAVR